MSDDISKKIRSIRESKGLLQSEVAKKIGLNRVTYISVESGKRKLNIDEAIKLCETLDISLSELLNGKKEEYNPEAFKQLYYYILKKCLSGKSITKTKLAKLFYLIDFTSYYLYDRSVTGASYYKNSYGPLAKTFLSTTDLLFEKGLINIRLVDVAQLISISESNKEYNPDFFSEREKEIIDNIYSYWEDKNTSEIVNFTHNQSPWRDCVDKDCIPYELIKSEEENNIYAPTSEMIEKIKSRAKA